MMHIRKNFFVRYLVAMGILAASAATFAVEAQSTAVAAGATKTLPERLTSEAFWKMVTDISEPGGYFQIEDNYTSNEAEVARIFTMLRERNVTPSVYMGVGPEQNLSYIAAVRPRFAFIVDIRRQAVMQHLMFKAMFELAKDRADFISILFSKPRPAGVDTTTAIDKMWDAFWYIPLDTAYQRANYIKVVDRLTKTHGFVFTAQEMGYLQNVLNAFPYYGPEISTRGAPGGRGGGGSGNGTTFADLTGYEYDVNGQRQSFMTTEANYRYVKSMHERNLIVPVSGDFGGPKAIRAIGAWMKENGGVLSAYYVSNVEQYLFQDGKAAAFYANVATLPLDENSIFIRPYALRNGASPLCPVLRFLAAAQAGRAPTDAAARACPQ